MDRSTRYLIHFAVLAVTFFVACSPKSQSHDAPEQVQGTGDGGGGNTCQGRPLESYAVDITALPAFKDKLKDFFGALEGRADDAARLLTYTLHKKNWYILPCDLKTLPSTKIGAVTPTEQAALQTLSEVWIAKGLFEKMTAQDQADLIVHETLMGLRLLRFDSKKRQCLAYTPETSYCDDLDEKVLGSPLDLKPEDYEAIRQTTTQIRSVELKIDSPALADLLARQGFSFDAFTFRADGDETQISRADFMARLENAKASGYFPSLGHSYGNEHVTNEPCAVEYALKDGVLDVTITRGSRPPLHQAVSLPDQIRFEKNKDDENKKTILTGDQLDPAAAPETGKNFYVMHFNFGSEHELASVEVSELVQLPNGGGRITPNNSLDYFCSVP